ncbi:hypothetical protein BGX20_005628 [Mortierella sp. AD010]|nr:hypothetical protein BGX20_005628 [Mortierella sp. AD010]
MSFNTNGTRGTPMDIPTSEPDTQDFTSNSGENQGNRINASAGRGVVVPDSQDIGDIPTNRSSAQQSLGRKRTLRQRARPEPNMDSERLESKRSTLIAAEQARMWQLRYATLAQLFAATKVTNKCKSTLQSSQRTMDAIPTFDPISIMNYLTRWLYELGWATTTVFNYRTKILRLYDNTDATTSYSGYRSFMGSVAAVGVKRIRNINISLVPVYPHIIDLGHNHAMLILDLSRKLCWLLGTCALMRPGDIHCIDASQSKIVEGDLEVQVLFPKERRAKKRIIKTTRV